MFDLISIGDCVLDTFIPLTDAEIETKHNKRSLILRYGEKVPVGPSTVMVAGNAANDAVGASRLGMKTAIYTNVGNDQDAGKVRDKLKVEKVDTRYVVFNKEFPSNHNIVLDYKGERTVLIYHQPWKYQLPDLDKSKWVYLTSLSPSYADSNIVDQVINYLERSGAKLVFNPGTFQIKMGVKKNPRLLSLTEVLVVNVEEARLILGHKADDDIPVKKLLKEIVDMGPRMSVITDAGKGSYGFDGDKYYKLDVFPAKLVEMTGAGDAFATGLMAGLFHGESLSEALRWGAANGAAVVEQVGSQAGLLTLHQMQEKLKMNENIIAKEI
jgi:sugar/nucleoside kinase (ribokinase family)